MASIVIRDLEKEEELDKGAMKRLTGGLGYYGYYGGWPWGSLVSPWHYMQAGLYGSLPVPMPMPASLPVPMP